MNDGAKDDGSYPNHFLVVVVEKRFQGKENAFFREGVQPVKQHTVCNGKKMVFE